MQLFSAGPRGPFFPSQLVDRMPPLDESAYTQLVSGGVSAAEAGTSTPAEQESTKQDAQELANLLQLDLLGGETNPSPAEAPQPGPGPSPAAEPAPAEAASTSPGLAGEAAGAAEPTPSEPLHKVEEIVNDGYIRVDFQVIRAEPSSSDTQVVAYVTAGMALTGVQLFLAAPKYIEMVLEAPSSTSLDPTTQITQNVFLRNTMVGQRPCMLRLRVVYCRGSEQVVLPADVPPTALEFV